VRVGCTVLESFRLFVSGDWMPEGELVATIKGEFTPKPEMLLGQAFGRCIEKPDKYHQPGGGFRVPVRFFEDWRVFEFTDEMMAPALGLFDRRGVFEAKATKQYGDITVVAKADQIIGTGIIETKTKRSQFDFDKYAESYQWRYMLDLFEGATSVTYKIFWLDEEKDGSNSLRSVDSFTLYPYAELHNDCCELLARFAEYVKAKGLDHVLRERQRTYA
jgi:hypothetical protein